MSHFIEYYIRISLWNLWSNMIVFLSFVETSFQSILFGFGVLAIFFYA